MPDSQQQIDYGNTANDGTGDPLRTAFIKTDDNFDAIWAAGPVGSNVTVVNNTIATVNTNGNLVLAPQGVGYVLAARPITGTANNTQDLGTDATRWRKAWIGSGGANVLGDVVIRGNLTANNIAYTGNVFVGDLQGSVFGDDSSVLVDGITGTHYGSFVGDVRGSVFGDDSTAIVDAVNNSLSAASATVTGNISASYFIGNGSLLTGIAAGTDYSNTNVAAYLGSGVASNIVPAANVTYSLGNASLQWSELWVSGNTIYINGVPLSVSNNTLTVNGQEVLANGTADSISTTGTLTANTLSAVSLETNIIESADSSFVVVRDGLDVKGLLTVDGTVSAIGNVSATANIAAGNVIVTGTLYGLSGNVSASMDVGTDLDVGGNITGNTAGFAIGYRDIPQVAFTGNSTIAAADAGKHFYSTESTDYILTIADNSAVSWPVGTAITVVNRGTGNITVAQASGVSLYLAGNSSAGNRTVTTYGMATLLNVAANVWMINGTGVA